MAIDDDEVSEVVGGHFNQMAEIAPEWTWFCAAYENDFWRDSPFGTGDGPIWNTERGASSPIKMQTNMVWPFVAAHVSNLFWRGPRTKMTPPALIAKGAGRKAQPKDPATLEAMTDDWLARAEIKEMVTYGYQVALMGGAAAFKLGIRESADPLSRIWLDVLPRWECLWDERVRNADQQLYRGHIRYERKARIEEIIEATVGDEHELVALPDVIAKLSPQGDTDTPNDGRLKRYLQLLEFYDLEAEQLRYYIVDGTRSGATLTRIGKTLPIPWDRPDKRPAVPIQPIILSNTPDKPLRGVPAVRRVYWHNAETNLLLTVVAQGMRRDAERMTAYLKDRVGDEFMKGIQGGGDARWIPVDADTLDGLWKAIEDPKFAESLPMYKQWLDDARQDAQGFSDIMTGRQGKYLSATEAELLAGAGESTATEIASRMGEAVARTCELMHAILRETMGGAIRIQRGIETLTVDQDLLKILWQVEIQDAASTPVRDGQKKSEFLTVHQHYMTYVQLAGAPKPEPAAPGQQAPPSPVTPEVRAAAARMVDYIVGLFQLPEAMKWSAIQQAAQLFRPEGPKKPEEPEEPVIDEKTVHELLLKAQAAMPQPQGVMNAAPTA